MNNTLAEPEVVKGFSAVKMMRELRDALDKKIVEMTFEEERRFLDESLERDMKNRPVVHRDHSQS